MHTRLRSIRVPDDLWLAARHQEGHEPQGVKRIGRQPWSGLWLDAPSRPPSELRLGGAVARRKVRRQVVAPRAGGQLCPLSQICLSRRNARLVAPPPPSGPELAFDSAASGWPMVTFAAPVSVTQRIVAPNAPGATPGMSASSTRRRAPPAAVRYGTSGFPTSVYNATLTCRRRRAPHRHRPRHHRPRRHRQTPVRRRSAPSPRARSVRTASPSAGPRMSLPPHRSPTEGRRPTVRRRPPTRH